MCARERAIPHTGRTCTIGLHCSRQHSNSRQVWWHLPFSYHLGVPYLSIHVLGATPQFNSVLHWAYES